MNFDTFQELGKKIPQGREHETNAEDGVLENVRDDETDQKPEVSEEYKREEAFAAFVRKGIERQLEVEKELEFQDPPEIETENVPSSLDLVSLTIVEINIYF